MHAILVLKPKSEIRLKQGSLWIYSNEVDNERTPLKNFTAGELVQVQTAQGESLGTAGMSPQQLICGRLVSKNPQQALDESFFSQVLMQATAWRDTWFSVPFYRAIFAEGDGLPGLVADRYGDYWSLQLTTHTLSRYQGALIAALQNTYAPKGILLKGSDGAMLEGLSQENQVIGEIPQWVSLEENGIGYQAPLLAGQKTGWFYDHRPGRAWLPGLVKNKRVLDVFSYVGAWSIMAASAGAQQVLAVDASALALEGVVRNAQLNGVEAQVSCQEGDAFAVLEALVAAGEKFDVIITDPPAFIKRKKDFATGFKGYQRINRLALQLLAPQGFLIAASCSHHLSDDDLRLAVQKAAIQVKARLQLLATTGQGVDHPVHPAMIESRYLKTQLYRRMD